MELKDGGPAFPLVDHENGVRFDKPGMTLRQYYKAEAMNSLLAGLLANSSLKQEIKIYWEDIANKSGQLADAMIAEDRLAERKK